MSGLWQTATHSTSREVYGLWRETGIRDCRECRKLRRRPRTALCPTELEKPRLHAPRRLIPARQDCCYSSLLCVEPQFWACVYPWLQSPGLPLVTKLLLRNQGFSVLNSRFSVLGCPVVFRFTRNLPQASAQLHIILRQLVGELVVVVQVLFEFGQLFFELPHGLGVGGVGVDVVQFVRILLQVEEFPLIELVEVD